MKKLFLFLVIILFCGSSFAQGLTPFKLYQYDLKIINPAFVGIKNGHQFSSFVKSGVGESSYQPTSLLFSYETQIPGINSGIGVMFQNHSMQNWNKRDWRLSYNYQLNFNKAGNLTIGMNLDQRNDKIESDHSSSMMGNPNLGGLSYSNTNIDLGLVYHHNSFYGGITFNNILNRRKTNDEKAIWGQANQSIYTILGSQLQVNNWLRIKPSILYLKSSSWDIFDINFTTEFKGIFIAGFTHRIQDDSDIFSVNAGINVKEKIQIVGLVHSSDTDDHTVEVSLRFRTHSN
ncbi:PorP/SprF family type IX secretion system membrane protein [Reichenbachiella sp. MALMAid0571]|uniref:PorP/SprF family type IX secretion system membrane protein n=1 Tax=Reichenbachiella sp. MALMAid0571 TaxID=3143939 RepID=UPI0032DEC318